MTPELGRPQMAAKGLAPNFKLRKAVKPVPMQRRRPVQLTYIKVQANNETSRSSLSPPCLSRLRPQALVLVRVLQAVAGPPRTPHIEEVSKATTKGSPQARV